MHIEQELAAWDGKSAASIRSIYAAHKATDSFADDIISLLEKEACQSGATWLLKAWLEDGNRLDQIQTAEVFGALNQLERWQARLHVLQSIPYLKIADADCNKVYNFLRLALTDQNKFVRAWSYNGFYELSRQHAEYEKETRQYFEMAMRDEAPSVKARIRHILKNIAAT
jgi:hypothetical protein